MEKNNEYEKFSSVIKDRFGLLVSYIGGLALYFSTDFSTASSIRHYPTDKMVHPVVVVYEWLLVVGIFLVAIGFIIDFTKKIAPEYKYLIIAITLFPLWHLIPLLIGQ